MTDVVMGIDSSTQSCTVELRDVATGALVSIGRSPHPPTQPPVSEQSPDDWWKALAAATKAARSGVDVRIVSVGVGAQCHGLVATGSDGHIIRPVKLWNDTTSAPQSAKLIEQFGTPWWTEQIGSVPSAPFTISKLAWLRDNEPENFSRIRHLSVPHDWLTYRLTGRRVSERSDSSGTGYFSADTMAWRTDILNMVIAERDWESMLPEVLGPDDVAGAVTAEAAAELGIDEGAVVSAGGGDQHLAAQGIGLEEGDVAYSLGTSGVVFTTTPNPVRDPEGQIEGVANVIGGYLPLASCLNAMKVTDTASRLLGIDVRELDQLALSVSLDPDRPVLAAYLDGERFPRLPNARGVLTGMTNATSREDVALAAVEGVAMGLVRGERLLASSGIAITGRTVLVGGGARSQAYRQIIADLTSRPTVVVDAPEGTARGAAIQAAAAVRGDSVASLTKQWQPDTVSITDPQHDRNDVWDRYLRVTEIQADGQIY